MVKFLAQCIHEPSALGHLKKMLDRIEKCASAVNGGKNLADLLNEGGNMKALADTFGEENFAVGMQLLFKTALHDFTIKSFTILTDIGDKQKSFLFKTLGAWKQFDMKIAFQISAEEGFGAVQLVNPGKQHHWKELQHLPSGTLVTVFVKNRKKRSLNEEMLAAERCRAAFDVFQGRSTEEWSSPAMTTDAPATTSAKTSEKRTPRKSTNAWNTASPNAAPTGKPVASFPVTISKMDTFVHAGNAHLIISHIRDYGGKVELYVMRGEKKKVQLDADSIWGAEIRNGETIVFDFYGKPPQTAFLRDLARKVNKYTQMDKLAG